MVSIDSVGNISARYKSEDSIFACCAALAAEADCFPAADVMLLQRMGSNSDKRMKHCKHKLEAGMLI